MATHFVKWCKAKFLNGYRQISVLPSEDSEGKASDIEELLSKDYLHSKENLSGKDGPEKSESPLETEKKRELNFEEFECDVSVEGGDTGQERQEFSFTLYDFDGHGKITKDDIAGLVRTIYDAVGTTIKVPQGGSKTIKVKLAVSPDKRDEKVNNVRASIIIPQSRKGVNVTIKENNAMAVPLVKDNCQKNNNSLNSLSESSVKEFKDLLKDKEAKVKDWSSPSPEKSSRKFRSVRYHHAYCRHLSPELFRECSMSPGQSRRRCREQVASLQRQDLLEIIKANMEKNNLGLQQQRHFMNDGHQSHSHQKQNLHPHCRGTELTKEEALTGGGDCIYRRHYYQDLAGVDHLPAKLNYSWHSSTHHQHHSDIPCNKYKLLEGGSHGGNHLCSKQHAKVCEHLHHHLCNSAGRGKPGHHRSRSHDLSHNAHVFRYHLLEKDSQESSGEKENKAVHTRSRSHDNYEGQSPKSRPGKHGHSSSPHHQQRHRNREQERARAMAQVISWLEREHLGKEKKPAGKVGSPLLTERHEHHHVHEHIHHHYHHYQETPIIV